MFMIYLPILFTRLCGCGFVFSFTMQLGGKRAKSSQCTINFLRILYLAGVCTYEAERWFWQDKFSVRMLWVPAEACSKNISCLYHQKHSGKANSLHCMGQGPPFSQIIWQVAILCHCSNLDNLQPLFVTKFPQACFYILQLLFLVIFTFSCILRLVHWTSICLSKYFSMISIFNLQFILRIKLLWSFSSRHSRRKSGLLTNEQQR